jgi:hypothetical protein
MIKLNLDHVDLSMTNAGMFEDAARIEYLEEQR